MVGVKTLRGLLLIASTSLREPTFARTVILVVRHDPGDGALGLVLNRPLSVSVAEAVGPSVAAAAGVGSALCLGGPCEGPLFALHGRGPLGELGGLGISGLGIGGLDDPPDLDDLAGDGPFGDDGDDDDADEPPDPGTTVSDAPVLAGVRVTARREEIEHLMRTPGGDPPGRPTRYFAGYAGWGAGQLEGEVAEGAWRLHPAAVADVFAPPPAPGASGARRDPWQRLTSRLTLSRWIDPDRIPDDPSAN